MVSQASLDHASYLQVLSLELVNESYRARSPTKRKSASSHRAGREAAEFPWTDIQKLLLVFSPCSYCVGCRSLSYPRSMQFAGGG